MVKLVEKDVKVTLFRMALPMLAGTIAINTYNLVDTYFVAKLGTIQLAAMGFTFPVAMFLNFITGGIGTGITTLASHAMGRTDRADTSNIITNGILLLFILSLVLMVVGFLSINQIFKMLGADEHVLPYIKLYMNIWYAGIIFMAFPMMGNGLLISLGDSKSASLFMASGAVLNCILDPIMIFGWLGFPALGIRGAALATIISHFVSCVWLFYLLIKKYSLLKFKLDINQFFISCRSIFKFAIPASISMILMPVSAGVITALISRYGTEAVAAVSAAGRLEMFAFVIPMALGMSLIPFVSQNSGARRFDRIYEAKSYSMKFAFIYGIAIAIIFFMAAPYFAAIFTKDKKVFEIFILYTRIVAFGYGMMEIHRYCGFFLTGIHKPVSSTILNIVRIIILLIPLSYLGHKYFGIKGIFFARLFTDASSGIIGFLWVSWEINRKEKLY